jgi:chemotaxis protein CheD
MIHIGLGEYAICDIEGETLITHALGTCVALVVYCSISKKTAMAHIVLPKRDSDHHKNYQREAYFAEDIVPKIMNEFKAGPCKTPHLQVAIVGGAEAKNNSDIFRVGERNVEMTLDLLRTYGVKINKEETLGRYSRTVKIDVSTGIMNIKKQKMLL